MLVTCGEIMAADIVYIEASAPVSIVAKSMSENKLNEIPIVENNGSMRLVGLVNSRDIVIKLVAFSRDPRVTPVYEVMSANPLTCSVTDDINFALDLMDKCGLRNLPIINTERKLVGMLFREEIIRVIQYGIRRRQAQLGNVGLTEVDAM